MQKHVRACYCSFSTNHSLYTGYTEALRELNIGFTRAIHRLYTGCAAMYQFSFSVSTISILNNSNVRIPKDTYIYIYI